MSDGKCQTCSSYIHVMCRFDSVEVSRHRRITAWTAWERSRGEGAGYKSFCFGAGRLKASWAERIQDINSKRCCKDVSRTKPVQRPGCGANFVVIPRKRVRRLSIICQSLNHVCTAQSEICHGCRRLLFTHSVYITCSIRYKLKKSFQTCELRLKDPFVLDEKQE